MRRREFLQRTASPPALAGLSSVLPPNTLVAEAAQAQARGALPARATCRSTPSSC